MQSTTIPMYVSPSMSAAMGQLGVMLEEYRYSPRARAEVLAYVAREGTTAGCPILDPEDHQDAEQALEESFTAVPFDGPAWDDESVIFDAELLAEGNHPWPIPAVGDEDDRTCPDDEWPNPNLESLGIAPIRGGSEDAEPFTPSDEDLADYARWSAELDARRDAIDFYARHPLGEFNAIRTD